MSICVCMSQTCPSFWTVTTSGSSGVLSGSFCCCGKVTSTPTVRSGAVTMNTMSSTSMTSTSGVTLMSVIGG
jgi:hypothetical protein